MEPVKGKKRRGPPTNEEIEAKIREESISSGEAIELGPTTSDQGAMFERMRTRVSHGYMLKSTFDEAVKRRCKISYDGTQMPQVVSLEVFDTDVQRLQEMTDTEVDSFDDEVCHARMEMRDDDGGTFVSHKRGAGFGHDVFGFAYDLISGKWCTSNETGLHARCGAHLRMQIRKEDLEADVEIVCGFIFQLNYIRTPVMTPFGYLGKPPHLMKKGFEDIWSWKRFIPIDSIEIAPKVYRWKQLFTPDYAETVHKKFQ